MSRSAHHCVHLRPFFVCAWTQRGQLNGARALVETDGVITDCSNSIEWLEKKIKLIRVLVGYELARQVLRKPVLMSLLCGGLRAVFFSGCSGRQFLVYSAK